MAPLKSFMHIYVNGMLFSGMCPLPGEGWAPFGRYRRRRGVSVEVCTWFDGEPCRSRVGLPVLLRVQEELRRASWFSLEAGGGGQ